jgi:hypothetical protein
MFRHVFIPTENNNIVPSVTIPREWYGYEVEVIVFPVKPAKETNKENRENRLMKLCGAWISEKSAEDIISDIYNSRTSGKTRILEKI